MPRSLMMLGLLLTLVACGSTPTGSTSSAPTTALVANNPATLVAQAPAPAAQTAPAPVAQTMPATAVPTATTPAPTVVPSPTVPPSPPNGVGKIIPAPELTNDVWINSDKLTLAGLQAEGKVTLVDFWTFGCYNCRNTLPALRKWHDSYAAKGLTIVGVHFPEFGYERQLPNVRKAVKDLDIKFPVAIDNDGKTWHAYNQSYWPTMYLVDKHGQIRYMHIGEGAYDTTEQWIQYLLNE